MATDNDQPEEPAESPQGGADEESTAADAATLPAAPTADPAPAKPSLRDRAWSLRAMIAVAVASLLLGGAGGAGIVAATDHHRGDERRFDRFMEGPGGMHGPGGYGNGYGTGPGGGVIPPGGAPGSP